MIKPDFITMNKEELRQYVIQNQDDKDAFYQYVDRLKSNSNQQIYSHSLCVNETEKVIANYVKNNQINVN
ncbi:DUF6887 family protein [Geminocystis herdmanii]|uniref:DUF6887 family protein n=1 Tax=Geminocystis herdmanii TaxID=669359 RepID=UPI0003458EBC|nr:hypothetical protein [Geminocystis herdmanii]